ncbi:MAG: 2-amino-4-hydroxy-6-hydroxymethyldihydropteridine diphosphokinase [Candidatus Omnitrophota bacterium]
MSIVYLGLGSNIGDRKGFIHQAVDLLAGRCVKPLRLSTIIETAPVGGPPQGLFLNAVLKAESFLSPLQLLRLLHQIEERLGRVRTVKNGPRTIDIDILLYDNLVLNTPELVLPHPRMHLRDFVMRPLREIDPDAVTSLNQDF